MKSNTITGITDMHCHVLPGVDDGPKTIEESIALLQEASRQGIRTMIVTPHFYPERYTADGETVSRKLYEVRKAAISAGIEVDLIPGRECLYCSELISLLDADRSLTMAGSTWVLVEFTPNVLYSMIRNAVYDLTRSGYRPIIAHFERYDCLYRRDDCLDELREGGAMLQLNFDRLLEKDSFLHPNRWRQLLKDGYVDFLGSDTHGMAHRPLHVRQALDWMEDSVSPEITDRVLFQNVCRLTEPNNVNWKVKAK